MLHTLKLCLLWLVTAVAPAVAVASTAFCNPGPPQDAAEQDRNLRFAAQVRTELENSGRGMALLSRSGTDLSRVGLRYSHAGIALREHADLPWAIRQLYFDCDTKRARLFDQGLAGFVLGARDAQIPFVSVVFLPDTEDRLNHTARRNADALALLGPDYSASAYAFSTRYQNCNQWVAELLATAWWGHHTPAEAAAMPETPRALAQRLLAQAGYQPASIQLTSWWWHALARTSPWLREDDHPPEHQAAWRYDISVPESLEAFVRVQHPTAQRVELCRTQTHMVIRRGWRPLPDDCSPEEGDTVLPFEGEPKRPHLEPAA